MSFNSLVRMDMHMLQCESAHGWRATDLTTRSGLKKTHSRFNEISKKLEAAYTTHTGNEKIMGGIVGIWAKMSADALLRDKLFKDGMFLLARQSRSPCLVRPWCLYIASLSGISDLILR